MTRAMVLRFQCVADFPTHCVVVPVEMDNWGGIAVLREGEWSVTRRCRKGRGEDDLSYDAGIYFSFKGSIF